MTPRPMHPAPVWVVVLNYNGWRDTIECLESVARTEYPALRVIVVDNASADHSVEHIAAWAAGSATAQLPEHVPSGRPRLRPIPKPVAYAVIAATGEVESGDTPGDPWLTIMRSPGNLGFAGGNNVALRHLLAREQHGWVWVLNNDIVVAPEALGRMMAVATHTPAAGAVGATLLEYQDPDVVQAAGGGTYGSWHGLVQGSQAGARRGTTVADRPLDFVSGGCALIELDVIRRAGMLDERFFLYAEDIDWSIRIRAAGFRLLYAPDAEVWHKGGATTVAGSPFNDFHTVRSSLLLVHKHTPFRLPVAAAYLGYRCVAPKIWRRQWNRLAAVRRAYASVMRSVAGT